MVRRAACSMVRDPRGPLAIDKVQTMVTASSPLADSLASN